MKYAYIVMDVGAAIKAYHVVWNNPDLWSDILIHLGDFHAMMILFSAIGNNLAISGFEDNSTYAVTLIHNSVKHCMTLANNGTEDQSPPKNTQIKSCRLVVCNLSTYGEVIKHTTANLIKDGMQLDMKLKSENSSIIEDVRVQYEPNTAVGKAIKAVSSVMKKVNHALYKGDVYRKVEKGIIFILL